MKAVEGRGDPVVTLEGAVPLPKLYTTVALLLYLLAFLSLPPCPTIISVTHICHSHSSPPRAALSVLRVCVT